MSDLHGPADGESFVSERDEDRLNRQRDRLFNAMRDERWHTSSALVRAVGDNWASVSARVRDLRKPKFGAHLVERRYLGNGMWSYRLTINPHAVVPTSEEVNA